MDALRVVVQESEVKELHALRRYILYKNWFSHFHDVDVCFCGGGGVWGQLGRKMCRQHDASEDDLAITQRVLKHLQTSCAKHGLPVPSWAPGEGGGALYDEESKSMVPHRPQVCCLRHLGMFDTEDDPLGGGEEVYRGWVKNVLHTPGMTARRIARAFTTEDGWEFFGCEEEDKWAELQADIWPVDLDARLN